MILASGPNTGGFDFGLSKEKVVDALIQLAQRISLGECVVKATRETTEHETDEFSKTTFAVTYCDRKSPEKG